MAEVPRLPGYGDPVSSSPPPEANPRQELGAFLHRVWQRWYIVLGAALVASGAAWYHMSKQPPVYTAEVLLQRAEAPTLEMVGVGAAQGGGMDFASQLEIIRSRAVLEHPVDSLGLQVGVTSYPSERSRILKGVRVERDAERGAYALVRRGGGVALTTASDVPRTIDTAMPGEWLQGPAFALLVDPAALKDEPVQIRVTDRTQALDRLQRSLLVEPGKGPMLIRISYSHPDPEYAAAVVNLTAESYTAFRARSAREAASVRREFLAQQLEQMADSLRFAQNQLRTYQEGQGSLDPQAEGSALVGDLMNVQGDIRQLQYEERLLAGFVSTLRAEGRNPGSLQRLVALGGEVLPGGPQLYNRLSELGAERDRLTASRFGLTEGSPQVEAVDSMIAVTWQQVDQLAEQSLALRRTELRDAQLRAGEIQEQVGEIPQLSAQFSRLEQEVGAVGGIYDLLLGRYYEAQIAEAVETGDVSIVDRAPVPLHPNPSQLRINLAIAFVVGTLLGLGVVGVQHYSDTRVRRANDAERAADLQVLSLVPHMNSHAKRNLAVLESFRWLATSLRFVHPRSPQVLAITSAAPAEGKSTIAANLAATLAQQGQRVLVIDADLRRPTMHDVFKAKRGPGLSDVLHARTTLEAAVQATSLHGASLLAAGSPASNPPALLGGPRFLELLRELRRRYDAIVIDTTPVLAVSDATVISNVADGILFVVRADRTDQMAIARATEVVRRAGGTLLGLVLTDVPTNGRYSRESYGYSDYASYYAAPADDSWHGRHREKPRLLGPVKADS